MNNEKILTKEEEEKMERILMRSRTQILTTLPFFGILVCHLQLEKTYSIQTAATDGMKFFYNPSFIKTLKEPEVNWLVVHEVLHPALKHLWRRSNREAKRWNIACDYAIHSIMIQYIGANPQFKDLLTMPKGVLYNEDYDNMSSEQIYDKLPVDDNGALSRNGSTLDDHTIWKECESKSSSQKEKQAQEWDGRLVSAAKTAESYKAGSIPAYLQRLIGKIISPQKNWRVLLADFVEPEVSDYSFNPPDRRFQDNDFFLPDLNDTEDIVKKIIFYIDTSGSITDKDLLVLYSEIIGACNQFSNKLSGWIGFFDHEAYPLTQFENIDDILKIKPKGGGGTSFEAPFEYINKEKIEDVSGIIILTDGQCTWPKESIANEIPVLWLINNEDIKPPWGLHATIKT